MPKVKFIIIFFFLFFVNSQIAYASANSYITIVNPVRGRNLWQNVNNLKNQINVSTDRGLPTTWLVQYDTLQDNEISQILKNLPDNQEVGLFLEVSQNLAEDSLAAYTFGRGDWAKPNKVFLSGYSPKERINIIDRAFHRFYVIFGYYPKSVGAWYIDSLSLNYLVNKYHVKTALICADQYSTDAYRIWGQPWSIPYYPSKLNTLIPAKSDEEKLNILVVQWALRDPLKGYGKGIPDSTYSLQANDYVGHHRLDISYFDKLLDEYIDSPNIISQGTLGLEVGQEATFMPEYLSQINSVYKLSQSKKLKVLTLSQFADWHKNQNINILPNSLIIGKDLINNSKEKAFWFITPRYRLRLIFDGNSLKIDDLRSYTKVSMPLDALNADLSEFLDRQVPAEVDNVSQGFAKQLISDVKSLDYNFDNSKLTIKIVDESQKSHLLALDEDKIIFDDKQVWFAGNYSPNRKSLLLLSLFNFENKLHLRSNFRIGYTVIDKSHYLGLICYPSLFVGLKSSFPYVTIQKIPFQTLVRFKSIPQINTNKLLFKLLSN